MTEEEKMELVLKLAQGARIGSLIMDNHGTMNIDNRMSDEDSAKKQAPQDVPERLATETARETMVLLVDAGLLSADWQPVGLSGAERGLVARAVCERLRIEEVWQVFGLLWNEKPETLRSYFNKALEQKKSLEFQDRLKNILG
jgi:hypothetical protein